MGKQYRNIRRIKLFFPRVRWGRGFLHPERQDQAHSRFRAGQGSSRWSSGTQPISKFPAAVDPQLRSEKRVKAVTGCTDRSPIAADAIEDEVQEALAICGGGAIAALRITLIANAFLEAEIDRLSAAVSSG